MNNLNPLKLPKYRSNRTILNQQLLIISSFFVICYRLTTKKLPVLNYYQNDFVELWVENDILYCIYKPISSITLIDAKTILSDRVKVQKELAYPVLCDIRNLKSVVFEARHYLAVEGSLLTKAIAYLSSPLLSEELVKFYIHTNKPQVPTKVFREKLKALEFLKEYR